MRKVISEAAEYLVQKRRHRKWMKTMGILACMVMIFTVYALILPAVTMEKPEDEILLEETYEEMVERTERGTAEHFSAGGFSVAQTGSQKADRTVSGCSLEEVDGLIEDLDDWGDPSENMQGSSAQKGEMLLEETESESETETETESETETERKETEETEETESEEECRTEPVTETVVEWKKETERETAAETIKESETEVEQESEAEAESETEPVTETVVEWKKETETETESETEITTEVVTEEETKPEPETEVLTEEVEPESETAAETIKKTETEIEAETEVLSEEAEPESETESETADETIKESETEAEQESEAETELDTEQENETELESASETEAESETELESESESESEAETEQESCYDENGELICKLEEHTHGADCYDENGALVCELEEHTHIGGEQLLNHLTEEEQAQVDAVIAAIDALPELEEIAEKLSEFEEAQDYEGMAEYYAALSAQVEEVKAAYDALSEEQQAEVTNLEKLTILLEMLGVELIAEANPVKLTRDSAYVNEITISGYNTGTAPFDENDDPGNDSSDENMVVRTFDTITYKFNVKYLVYENGALFNDARVKMEFVLPLTIDQAEFDQTAMGWMEDAKLTTEDRKVNGTTTSCQVLTGYKHLLPSQDHTSVVPGEFGENLTIKVKMMNNGAEIAPIISAAMEYNTWDGTCETHKGQANGGQEKKTITAGKITVSAAPKYNVQIKKAFANEAKQTFDFGKDSSSIKNAADALNTDAGVREGRIFTYGVTLQLYNDNASKGMKGIELPQGPITFDITLTSQFQPIYASGTGETIKGTTLDVTTEYTPLVWSYDVMSSNWCRDRDTSMTNYTKAYSAAPFNSTKSGGGTRYNTCYDGGTWSAVQKENVIHFTVEGYSFDGVFPCTNDNGTNANTDYYNWESGIQNIGCFSSLELYIVQPFTKVNEDKTQTYVLNDFSTGGLHAQDVGNGSCNDGTFIMKLVDGNLQATSVTDQSLSQVADNSNQGNTADDTVTVSENLKRPGSYEQRHLYSEKGSTAMKDIFGVVENAPGTCAKNGDDWAVLGQEFSLVFGGYAKTNGDDDNKMCAAKWLLKFDADAIELLDGDGATGGSGATQNYSYTFLYATKSNGANWTNDAELKATAMKQLCYYSTIAEAKEHGQIVGILIEAQPKTTVEALPSTIVETYFRQNARVKVDASLANQKFIITEESMIWTVNHYTAAEKTIPTLLGNDPSSPTKLPQYTYYINAPSVYKNGDGTYDQHVGNYTQGDTLLVLGYQASILKKVEQLMADSEGNLTDQPKDTYSLDADQRVIDFVLDPSVKFVNNLKSEKQITTTVTIVDTLPQYLTYRAGSSYLGGTYTQTSVYGGTAGTITSGVLQEPTVTTITKNGITQQKLTWVIENVTVGETMPLIHYAVDVGTKGDEEKDVPMGTTNLTNTVQISAIGDDRIHSIKNGNLAEEGVVLTRGMASSYGKYSKNKVVEPDGEINYVIYYDNNSTVAIEKILLLDTMPWNGAFGNAFSGSYTVTKWKIDSVKCDPTQFKLYYTMNTDYVGKSVQEIPQDEILNWTSVSLASAVGEDGTVTVLNGKMPAAWALYGDLGAGQGVYIDLQITLDPEATANLENNVYHNMFSCDKTTTITEEHTVTRSLEGLTWLDENADGIQNEEDAKRISGVKVELLKLTEGGNAANESDYEPFCYSGTTTPMVIKTGEKVSYLPNSTKEYPIQTYGQGRYLFTDLPAGTYAVRFTHGSEATDISLLIASPVNQGTTEDDIRDSDGIPTYNASKDTLLQTVILDITLPKAEEMSVARYESKYHDSGFYQRGYELPSTGGWGTLPYTAGGLLLIAAALLGEGYLRRQRSMHCGDRE